MWAMVKAIGSWVVKAVGAIGSLARAGETCMQAATTASAACRAGERYMIVTSPRTTTLEVPALLGPQVDGHRRLQELETKLVNLQTAVARATLQNGVMRLADGASDIDRLAQNLNLHMGQLNTHFHGLRNQVALVDIANRQNRAIRVALRGQTSLIQQLKCKQILPASWSVQDIRSVDVEPRRGAISIASQYEAFEDTRRLLIHECECLLQSLAAHIASVERVRILAADVPEWTTEIETWLTRSVIPTLKQAQLGAQRLIAAAGSVPTIAGIDRITAVHDLPHGPPAACVSY